MAKNDFDIDFDFEEEYGFDPKAVLGDDFEDADLDFSDLDDMDLGLEETEETEQEPDYSDFDVDALDLEDLKLDRIRRPIFPLDNMDALPPRSAH